jgi:hypothetical protein
MTKIVELYRTIQFHQESGSFYCVVQFINLVLQFLLTNCNKNDEFTRL